MAEDQSHTRTYEWLEPAELAATTGPLSGQQYLEAWTGGELAPPMAATLGFGLTDFGEGHVEIRCTPDEYHYNPYGAVHGGLAATLLDSTTGLRHPISTAGRSRLRHTQSCGQLSTPHYYRDWRGSVHRQGRVDRENRRSVRGRTPRRLREDTRGWHSHLPSHQPRPHVATDPASHRHGRLR